MPALSDLGKSAPVLKEVYSRSEKSSRDLAAAAVVALKLKEPPSIYHDGDSLTDLDALLSRVDITAVTVVLPITLQPSIVLKALAAGKHVLSEKPVAPDVKQGSQSHQHMQEEYQRKGLIWRVAENCEAEPGIKKAAEIIRSRKLCSRPLW